MRVRTSTGVRPQNFYGNLFMTTTTDVELASMNADKVSNFNFNSKTKKLFCGNIIFKI